MVDVIFHCDEKGNFSKGYAVRGFIYTDYCIEMHNHDFYELNIVLDGTGIHRIENGRFPVRSGDVFMIPPMVAHAYVDTENLEVYHILLKKSFVVQNQEESKRVKGFLQFTEIEPFLRSNFTNSCFLHLSPPELVQLRNELSFIDDNSGFSWEECAAMKYHAVWKLLYWFSNSLYKQTALSGRSPESKYEIPVIHALEYIHRHFAEKITIDILCKEVFLSRSTFLRSFKLVCGVSPIEYLNNYRCKRATEQLAFAECSKTEVAHNCGFYDLSHMERMLKNYR